MASPIRLAVILFSALALNISHISHAALTPTKEQRYVQDVPKQNGFARTGALDGDVVMLAAPTDNDFGSASGAVYVFNATTGAQLSKLHAAVPDASQSYGSSVAMQNGIALIGAERERNTQLFAGVAYVVDPLTGVELRRLVASDPEISDGFGHAVAMDNGLGVIGAPSLPSRNETGKAYLFDLSTGQQLRKFIADDSAFFDTFGSSVAIDENLAVVGAPRHDGPNSIGQGAAYVFDVTTGQQLQKLVSDDMADSTFFGQQIDIDGNIALVGAPSSGQNSGSAFLFDASTGERLFKLKPNDPQLADLFGNSVKLENGLAFVGGGAVEGSEGAIYVFEVATGEQILKFETHEGGFGHRVLDAHGDRLLISDPGWEVIGAGYLYSLSVPGPDSFDFNGDGKVDEIDEQSWAANYGKTTGAARSDGDGDNDGDVDGDDFLGWQRSLGWAANAEVTAFPVPEPSFLAIGLALAVCCARTIRQPPCS